MLVPRRVILMFFVSSIFSGWWLTHPCEKYARQNGTSSPNRGETSKKYLKFHHHLVMIHYSPYIIGQEMASLI